MAAHIDRQEIDRVLQSRRKQREAKACYPCRQRKVKCDNTQPCRTCCRRAHPEICAYDIESSEPRNSRHNGHPHRAQEQSPVGSNVVEWTTGPSEPVEYGTQSHPQPTAQTDPEVQQSPPQRNLPQDQSESSSNTYIYSGDNSVMSILGHRTNGSMAQEVSSVLGLQNTYSSYPFMDIKSTSERWVELLRIIPQRTEVLRFFQFYRQSAYPFNPILVDIERFELDLCTYLNAYAAGEFHGSSHASGKWTTDRSIGHISLLLATLSAGAHYSDLEHPHRSEICQDLARRSFQALRLANFLFRPSLDTVQSLLILGNTLQNNGQSDAAWALLGTTVRLAQTLGLHTERSVAHLPECVRLRAKALWFTIVWQDSLLSLCYDRPAMVSVNGWPVDQTILSRYDLSYTEVMHYLCRLGIEITTANRENQEVTLSLNMLNSLDDVYRRAMPYLRSRTNCKSMQQNLEHLALKMHVSLGVSVLTRPALKKSQVRDPPHDILRARAKSSLLDASRAFLEFQALSVVPLRSWSMVHTVLSSTLLLCIWEDTRNDEESRDLQQRVIEVFSETGSVGTTRPSSGSENGQWLFERHIRALITLRNAVRCALEQQKEDSNPGQDAIASETLFPAFELPPGFGEGFESLDQIGVSPISYLDSIMNVPLFDFSQENQFP